MAGVQVSLPDRAEIRFRRPSAEVHAARSVTARLLPDTLDEDGDDTADEDVDGCRVLIQGVARWSQGATKQGLVGLSLTKSERVAAAVRGCPPS